MTGILHLAEYKLFHRCINVVIITSTKYIPYLVYYLLLPGRVLLGEKLFWNSKLSQSLLMFSVDLDSIKSLNIHQVLLSKSLKWMYVSSYFKGCSK